MQGTDVPLVYGWSGGNWSGWESDFGWILDYLQIDPYEMSQIKICKP